MSKRKLRLKPKVRIAILTILTLLLLPTTILVSNKYSLKEVSEFVSYTATGHFDYEVCYKKNNYVSEKCFSDDNRAFVNALIDNINIDFNYALNLSQNAEEIEYSYSITAQVLATEKNNQDKILYSETEVLFEDAKKIDDTSFVILDNSIAVDFQKYNTIITEFKKNYALSMNSKLIITATLDIKGSHSHLDQSISNHRSSVISFSLAEQTVNALKDNTVYKLGDTVVKYTSASLFSKPVIIVLITYLFDIMFLGMWCYTLMATRENNKTFDGKINKILKQYDRSIVRVENLPLIKDYEQIKVSSFEELLDVKDNLVKPILYNRRGPSAKFVVISDNQVFIYEIGVYTDYEK